MASLLTAPASPSASVGDLTQRVATALANSSYSALHDIAPITVDAAVYLRGEIPSFFLKQIAQQIVTRVPGVRNVCNELVVVPASLRSTVSIGHRR